MTSRRRAFPKAEVLGDIFSLAVNTHKSIAADARTSNTTISTQLAPQIADVAAALRRAQARRPTRWISTTCSCSGCELLQEHAEVREHYQRRFQFILVDEYQDTNKLQSDLIDLLAARHHNVMVVGDDAQSIYAWRGANFQNILKFPERYPGGEDLQDRNQLPQHAGNPDRGQRRHRRQRAPVRQGSSRPARKSGREAGAGGVQRRGRAGGVRGAARAGTARGRRGLEQDGGALPLAFPRAGTAARTDAAQHPVQHHQRHPVLRAGAHQGRDGVSEAGRQPARRTVVQAPRAAAAGHRRQGGGQAVAGVSGGGARTSEESEIRTPKPSEAKSESPKSDATRSTKPASHSPLALQSLRRQRAEEGRDGLGAVRGDRRATGSGGRARRRLAR